MRNRKLVRWVVGCAVTGVLVAGIAIGGTALADDKSDKAPKPEREAPAVEQVETPQANTLSEHEWT
jgi:hypothetical protein